MSKPNANKKTRMYACMNHSKSITEGKTSRKPRKEINASRAIAQGISIHMKFKPRYISE